MFGSSSSKEVQVIREVVRYSQGGIFKRIDENRELLELLQQKAPELLDKYFWVEGWLRSQDAFLNDVLRTVPVEKNFTLATVAFPRPWPGEATPTTPAVPTIEGGSKSK
jgi:hypothetical protein